MEDILERFKIRLYNYWNRFNLINIRIKYFVSLKNPTYSESETISVKGMTCSHCEESVIKSLKKIKGVKDVSVELKTGEVEVVGSEYNLEEVKKTIVDLGFKL